MEKNIADLITTLEVAVKSTSAFVVEQSPIYIQQLIKYKIITTSMWLILWIVFACVIVITTALFNKKIKIDDGPSLIWWGILVALMPMIGVAEMSSQLLKLTVAPSVYILEYLKSLL